MDKILKWLDENMLITIALATGFIICLFTGQIEIAKLLASGLLGYMTKGSISK